MKEVHQEFTAWRRFKWIDWAFRVRWPTFGNYTQFEELRRVHLGWSSRMTCEKASRRLKFLLGKAKRLGLNAEEVVELPATKRLLSTRVTSGYTAWTILAVIALILAGGAVLAFLCAPCVAKSRAWGCLLMTNCTYSSGDDFALYVVRDFINSKLWSPKCRSGPKKV